MDLKTLHSHLNSKVLTNMFFDLAEERYPAAEKLKQMATRLVSPLSTDPLIVVRLKIGVLTVMRDTVKKVAPNYLYRSIQHRDDLYLAIIEALEDLEDELEDLQEELEEDEETEA